MRRRQSCEIVLIGKNILVREGISRILHAANFHILLSASSADELPNALQTQQLLFLIIHNGDSFDVALDQIRCVKGRCPGARIAIVSDHYRQDELVVAYRAGASGYFVNVNSCDAFVKSIELVTMGETVFPPAFLAFALDGNHEREAAPTGDEVHEIVAAAEDTDCAASFSTREGNPVVFDRGQFQQVHRPKDRHRRGDRESPRQGDPAQDPGPEPDASCDLGNEQRAPGARREWSRPARD